MKPEKFEMMIRCFGIRLANLDFCSGVYSVLQHITDPNTVKLFAEFSHRFNNKVSQYHNTFGELPDKEVVSFLIEDILNGLTKI